MKNSKNNLLLTKIFIALFLIAPLVLFFSYYPIISFGSTDSMNLELSLPLIWLILYDICAIILYFADHHKFPPLTLQLVCFFLFPIYLSLSIFWSPNPLRGILTAGIVWLIFIAIYLSYKLSDYLKPLKTRLIKSIFVSAVIISIWCWLQSIMDLAGLDRSQTLMCQGCATITFGFPHPNGFAIEPQFMGNLLLAPTILAVFYWYKKPSLKQFLVLFLLSTTLFFTFSRGAIYSFILAIAVLLMQIIIKKKTARPLLVLPILLFSFVFSLNAQGLMAAASSTNDTYLTGITKSLDQLTLGIFHLKVDSSATEQNQDITDDAVPDSSNFTESSIPPDSVFDGYIEVSTTARLMVVNASLKVWSSNPVNLLFGVGIGGSGRALYEAGELDYSAEAGQNEYCTILLESGIIGVVLLTLVFIMAIKTLPKAAEYLPPLFSIVLAYLISIFFFSGLPNALQIYLFPVFWPSLLAQTQSSTRKKLVS